MAAVFGLRSPRLAEDPPSASPSPRAHDSSHPADSSVSKDPKARTVVLVEDNPTDVFVIKEVIGKCELNLDLRVVNDGQDALEYFRNLTLTENAACPALVLLDLNLPKIGGIEILRHLRLSSRCSRTPVIVVTSSTAEADRVAVARLGAEAYFQKPASLQAYMKLGQLIKQHLQPQEEHES